MKTRTKCKICGSSSVKDIFCSVDTHGRHVNNSSEKFRVSFCDSCKVVFLPEIKINGRYYKKYYETGYYEEPQAKSLLGFLLMYFRQYSYSKKEKIIRRNTKKRKVSILDIGCGSGDFLDSLESDIFNKNGLEINPEGQLLSRQKGIRIFEEELPKLKIKEKFDAVTLWHVLEHVENQEELFQNIYNILSKKGILVIQTPNSGGRGFKYGRKDWFHLDSPRHLFLHNKKSLKFLAEKTGFKVKKIVNEYYDYPLDLFWSVRNHRFKLFFYLFYPVWKYMSEEHLTYILEKKK